LYGGAFGRRVEIDFEVFAAADRDLFFRVYEFLNFVDPLL
jgi:hypothetical protein